MKARINKIAYIGWQGIDYEELSLDSEVFTGLIGPTGAGKSSLVMFLDYALLPDRQFLDVQPISEINDPQKSGIDQLASRISIRYGYAYVVFDITTRHDKRLIAGINVCTVDGRVVFKRWVIDTPPMDTPLKDVMCIVEGDKEYYPDFQPLRRHLASLGIDLHFCKNISEYGQALYDAGILPTNLIDKNERALYGKLIETAFKGGISSEVAIKLKDYLLPEARYIPETVSKLHDCTDQVLRTRRTVDDANKHLILLESTYGTGKKIVTNTLCLITLRIDEATQKRNELQGELNAKQKTAQSISNVLSPLKEEIQIAEDTKKNIQAAKQTELKDLEDQKEEILKTEQTRKTEADEANKRFRQFRSGEKLWSQVADQRAHLDLDSVKNWNDKEISRLDNDIARKNIEIENLQKERQGLESISSNPLVEELAKITGGTALEEAFAEVSDKEAISLEMALSGLTEGITGVSIDALHTIAPTDVVPELFWLGENPPKPKLLREIGEWNVCATLDGYIVSSKHRRPIFGHQARQDRKNRLDEKIKILSDERKMLNDERSTLDDKKTTLLSNIEAIHAFLENRDRAQEIQQNYINAKKAYEEASGLLSETKKHLKTLQDEIYNVVEPYNQTIAALKSDYEGKVRQLERLNNEIRSITPSIDKAVQDIEASNHSLKEARDILSIYCDSLMAEADALDTSDDEDYTIEQTKRLSNLSDVLQDEPASRIAVLQEASASDPLSCLRLWPTLMEVLRDRIPIELVDSNGEDLIKKMRDRRSDLDEQLKIQEQEVKIHAKSIYSAIQSEIRSQQKKIANLSRLGENLHFGNVTGIRIKSQTRGNMLEVLERFAEQLPLFSQESKPIDEALAEFFRSALDLKMDGKNLLDYRSYMNLVIEARRKGGDWELAASLSGGESIGCGLAMALMLTRSLASRGEIRQEHITPLFAVDEVHRLDAAGHKVIADFGKREGFQIFVTAADLKPWYRCTLYTLNRIHDPEERLIIRGARIREEEGLAIQ